MAITTALLFCGSAHGANFCKWTDENGVVHYAEKCPDHTETEQVEIQPPPSQEQADDALKRYALERLQQNEQEEISSGPSELSAYDLDQMRDQCISARLSLDALSKGLPVYYDKQGQLQADLHKSVRVEFDRSGSYLNADTRKNAHKFWNLAKQKSCTSAVSGSGIRSAMRRRQKEHLKGECEIWKNELEYMERHKGFRQERRKLTKLFSSNCE